MKSGNMSKQEQTRKTYKLPDGKITSSPHRYAREWLTICRAVEKKLDCQVYAFDPSIQMAPNDYPHASCTLPLWVVKKILQVP